MHDLRRTFVSHLAMAGVNEAVVRELAGHSSITTTLCSCTGIISETLRDAQCRLPYVDVLQDVSDTYHEAQSQPALRKRAGQDSNLRPPD